MGKSALPDNMAPHSAETRLKRCEAADPKGGRLSDADRCLGSLRMLPLANAGGTPRWAGNMGNHLTLRRSDLTHEGQRAG